MTEPSHAVFLSYASQDAQAAQRICASLRAAGVEVWFDQSELRGGDAWDASIRQQIRSCALFIPVISVNTRARDEGYFRLEWKLAVDRSHLIASDRAFLLPVAIDESRESDARVPDRFREVQWTTLPHGEATTEFVDWVARLLAGAASSSGWPVALSPDVVPIHAAGPSRVAASRGQSIAVLPFENMSAERDQEYFSDGLAEEVINRLARVPGLRVIARTSSFSFRGRHQDVRMIASALGVTHVVEGSVRRAGSRLRIAAQLIQADYGTQAWSERYDRELSDVFAIQDEISSAIVAALRFQLSADVADRPTRDVAAYEAFLKARHLAAKVTPESLDRAKQYYEQAIQLDPAFPLAHVGLGNYWISVMIFGRCSAHEAVPAARKEGRRALEIDPSLPEAHGLMGLLAALYDFDWAAAERHFDFPGAKEVGFAAFRPTYAWCQYLCGNVEQAISLAQRAIDRDPLDVWPRMNMQAYLQAAGRGRDALEQLHKVLEIDEHQVVAMVAAATIHASEGDLTQAFAVAQRAHAIAPWYLDAVAALAALQRLANEAAALPLMQALEANTGRGDAPARVVFHLLCGEVDLAADWAERAIQERDLAILVYLRFAMSKELRASDRWPRIAAMLNLRQ